MNIETEYDPKPAAPFPYTMKTTSVMEHSRGVAWTANLLRDGVKIGIVEQMGDGGADRVYLPQGNDAALWEVAVDAAFDGNEEDATFYLLCLEES